MRTINVLILGVGGNVSQGIMSAVRNSSIPCRIVGACISPESLGLYYCDAAYISPYANDPQFIDWVTNICNKENIDIVLSGVEENIVALESQRTRFEAQTKALFIASPLDMLQIGQDKYLTAQWLKKNNLHYPKSANANNEQEVCNLIETCGFPLIAKPNVGKGSQGIFIIEKESDIKNILNTNYCVQEFLGNENEEYTIACYMDKYGCNQDLLIMHRKLKYGTTFMAEIIQNDAIREECQKICKAFNPRGPLNVQLRMHHGIPICFELNVRFSGTTPIRAHWGYNDVEAMVREYLFDEPVGLILQPKKEGKVYRYFNEAFVDLDMQKTLSEQGYILDCSKYNNYIESK